MGVQRVICSGVKFESFDHEWGAIYVALTTTQEQLYKERLTHLIPRPKSKHAVGKNRPTIMSIEKDMKTPRWSWPKKKGDYTKEDKDQILKKVIEIQALSTFRNHYYKWGRKLHGKVQGQGENVVLFQNQTLGYGK